jgi:protein phosphatase 1H
VNQKLIESQCHFVLQDKMIYEEKQHFDISGGCTALVAVFFLGKLYVANAGDSRAVISRGDDVIPMSYDFTPESERERLRLLVKETPALSALPKDCNFSLQGFLCPDLLQNEFTHLEFCRRIGRNDIGKKILCRNARMKGWCVLLLF